MGDRLTEEKSEQASSTPYGDTFDALLPHYLAIGMPYDLYWDGEYGTRKAFREAYRIRMESEQKLADANNWSMGQYVMRALQAIPVVVNAANFSKTKPSFPSYPEIPLLQKAEQEKKEEDIRKKQEDQSMVAMAMFQAMITKFNQNVEKRLEKEKAAGIGQ